MTFAGHGAAALPVSEAAARAHAAALDAIAKPGAWWDGAARLAIAKATRAAPDCALCIARKASLSAGAVQGDHASAEVLPPAAVEAVHGIRNDSGRLTRRWFDHLMETGLRREAYVELAAIVACTVIVDTYAQGVGLPRPPLPEAVPGSPAFERSDAVADAGAWVPLAREGNAHILRALGLVPSASALFFATFNPCYYMRPQQTFAIGRRQVELIAARVSAVNECFY